MAATAVTVPDGKLTTSAKVRPTTGFMTQSHSATASTGPDEQRHGPGPVASHRGQEAGHGRATTTKGDPRRVTTTRNPEWCTGGKAAKAHGRAAVGPGPRPEVEAAHDHRATQEDALRRPVELDAGRRRPLVGPVMRRRGSRASNCSSESTTVDAAQFSSRCETFEVPGMGSITGDRRNNHARATWAGLAPTASATLASAPRRAANVPSAMGDHGMNPMPSPSQCSRTSSDRRLARL